VNADSSDQREPEPASESESESAPTAPASAPVGDAQPAPALAPTPADELPDHDLVMATARRIIASDAAIIHRLGTI
jgi:hypothetical protein